MLLLILSTHNISYGERIKMEYRFQLVYWAFVATSLAITVEGDKMTSFQRRNRDAFDVILEKMRNVTAKNCWSKSRAELELDPSSVSHVPSYGTPVIQVFSNRSRLLHLRNIALTRAYFYSLIYQSMNKTSDFNHQPGLMYLYMSASADVSANSGWINGSSLIFDNNSTYPNWLKNIGFNSTLRLFGIRAWRTSEPKLPTNWLREPMNPIVDKVPRAIGSVTNYTDITYKFCPYTRYSMDSTGFHPTFWWPDDTGYLDSVRKSAYDVNMKTNNGYIGKYSFYGPPAPPFTDGQEHESSSFGQQLKQNVQQPVKPTRPYFDCGRSNKWIVSMTSPVVDYMQRYSLWTHLRRPKNVAVTAMDVDFDQLDVNQCPLSEGNPMPNMFAGTARCRYRTTTCEPLSGFGLRRGGYQCVCRAGLYYPPWQDGPFRGADIEQSTDEQYNNGTFDCVTAEVKSSFHGRNYVIKYSIVTAELTQSGDVKTKLRSSWETFDNQTWSAALSVITRRYTVTMDNCLFHNSSERVMPREAAYGAATQFEPQGRTALRMAHFLSNFLQNVAKLSNFLRMAGEYNPRSDVLRFDHILNETLIHGEVIASVMGDFKIAGFGVFFDRNKFVVDKYDNGTVTTKEFFGPYAYKINDKYGLTYFTVTDDNSYVDKAWFKVMKKSWETNLDGLKKFAEKSKVPLGPNITFGGPTYEDGHWSEPTFKCNGMTHDWVVSYTVPFFGPTSSNTTNTTLEFKGVVLVDVSYAFLVTNQCPADSSVASIFKNTAKCHYDSQYCVPSDGVGSDRGYYNCICRHGYKYPFPGISGISGRIMEEEYNKMELGLPNRYESLRCSPVSGKTTSGGSAGGPHTNTSKIAELANKLANVFNLIG